MNTSGGTDRRRTLTYDDDILFGNKQTITREEYMRRLEMKAQRVRRTNADRTP